MHARKFIILLLALIFVAMMVTSNTPNVAITNNTEAEPEHIIIEGIRQYTLSAESSEYPDYSYPETYGTSSNEPPLGMGQDSGGSVDNRTLLTETEQTAYSWSEKQDVPTFSGLPTSWTASEIAYSGGYFTETPFDTFPYGGYIYSDFVDTSGSNRISFSLDIGGSWTGQTVSVSFWNGATWDHIGDYTDGPITTQTFTSTNVNHQISNFRVQVYYGLFDGDQSFQANGWYLEARYEYQYYAFQAVYRFDTVDYNSYSIEELHVDYSAGFSSTENLAFRFGTGNPPTTIIEPSSDGDTDFFVDIHSYLTGSTCYIEIRDTSRSSSDTTQNLWYIDRLYILLSEPAPVWDDVPTDKILEYSQPLSYQMNATLLPSCDKWWLNDTTNFAIDGNGLITNAIVLPVGTYGVQVSANDTWGRSITDDFTITVQDTVDPVWTSPITNQEEEYGVGFQYLVGATDASGIKSWHLNDSINFHIDNGEITNNTILEDGYYWLNVSVTDNHDNSISEIFSIFINDTVNPEWVISPVDQFLEYGFDFDYDLVASDLAPISWVINNSINFAIDPNNGTIKNITSLSVQTYGLQVNVTDSHGNRISKSFNLLVNDTILPVWVTDPIDQFREFGDGFIYDLDAFDIAGVHSWHINDTANFVIDSDGIVQNFTYLSVGNYSLYVNTTDAHGNTLDGYFILEVEDTTPPLWEIPPTQNLQYHGQLALQLHASDLAGIVQWNLNYTGNFSISSSGFLTSLGNLEDGWYYIEVTAIDAHGLSTSIVVTVFVALDATTPPSPIDPLLLVLTIGGIALGAVVLFASLRTWRAVQRDRLKQIEAEKGEVDTALDYLESIRPTLEGEDEDT
ncbi:hypothetical protein EU528_07635 [Candidatus Thorarchaeota archaeon]|nr:MAG: hypothetical protein EU528_07635 [Candidatus Thorarchaeota archaeon]